MNSIKRLSLTIGCTVVLCLFGASVASATELYKGEGATQETWGVGTPLTLTLEGGSSANLASTGGTTLDTCKASAVGGKVTNAGKENVPVVGEVESLTFGECTEPVKVTELGTLTVEWTGGHNGNVTAKGFQVDVDAFTNPSNPCKYSAGEGTLLGTLKGTTDVTKHASIAIDANVTKTGGPLLCPASARWIANYVVTSPTGLNVRNS